MRHSPAWWATVVGLGVALVAVWLRLAWIGDDAYITLRTVENLLAGHGPVWNTGERVQVFTHPLWMWLLAGARAVSGEPYFTTIALSVALCAAAAALLAALGGRAAPAVLALLLASRAAGDYATSGLETPLAALLLVWLAWLDDAPRPRPVRVVLALALLGTTRLDLVLLALPVAVAQLRASPPRRWPVAALALLPLAAWSAFAAFYYGSPFPITAYAKAFSNGVPASDLLQQGLWYAQYSLRHDPVTLATIAAGVVAGFGSRAARGRMLALGVLLYCGYVVKVGGDFMAGRFFVPPLVAAVALLARALRHADRRAGWFVVATASILVFVPGLPPYLLPLEVDARPTASEHGVIDERRFWFDGAGLFAPRRAVPVAGEGTRALRAAGRTRPLVAKCDAVGRDPFVAGELFRFVDRWIVDPLLMRLPIARPGEWRIGHFTRGVPDGYLESLANDDNRIGHPGLRACYADLRLVLRAPLGDGERFGALWRLWTGAHDQAVADYVADEYRTPRRRTVAAADLPAATGRTGVFWFDDARSALVGEGGIAVAFAAPVDAATLRVALAPMARYRFTFAAGGRVLASRELVAFTELGPPPPPDRLLDYLQRAIGFGEYELAVPDAARGFDRIDVDVDAAPVLVPALGGLSAR